MQRLIFAIDGFNEASIVTDIISIVRIDLEMVIIVIVDIDTIRDIVIQPREKTMAITEMMMNTKIVINTIKNIR